MKNKGKVWRTVAVSALGAVVVLTVLVYRDSFACGEEMVDIDGNRYGTLTVGGQCWTAENLKTTHLSDGRAIPRPESDSSWREAGEMREGAYACYNNEPENCAVYGALYNAYAVSEGVCPKGWRVPTDGDWKDLERELGVDEEEIDLLYWRGSSLATALAGEAELWSDASVGERVHFNETGFTAVPAGYRLSNGVYSWQGQRANFWSSTIKASGMRRTIIPEITEGIRRTAAAKNIGFSVRCVKE